MKTFDSKIGGKEGVRLRLMITTAYSLTSLAAIIPLILLVSPVIDIGILTTHGSYIVLPLILLFDLVAQTVYNERIARPVFDFLQAAEEGEPSREATENAAVVLLGLPRKIAFSSFLLWVLSVVLFGAHVFFIVGLPYLKVLYLVLTGLSAALVLLVFQYSLFRRLLARVGGATMRRRYRIHAVRRTSYIGTRLRLTGTLFILVFGALCFAGITSIGQYVIVAGEQAGVLASATLANLADELPASRSEQVGFLRERQRNYSFPLAVWLGDEKKLLGQLPVSIPIEDLLERFQGSSGMFEHAETMGRVAYRKVGSITIIAVVLPKVFLGGSGKMLLVTLGMLLFAASGSLIVLNAVAVDIVKPLSALKRYAQQLSEGVIGTSPTIVADDELGRLDGALRHTGRGLRRMFIDLRSSLEAVKSMRKSIEDALKRIQDGTVGEGKQVDGAYLSFSGLSKALSDIGEELEVIEKSTLESHGSVRQLEGYLEDTRVELTELLDTVRVGGRMILSMSEGVTATGGDIEALFEGISRLCSHVERMQKAFGDIANDVDQVGDFGKKALDTAKGVEDGMLQTIGGVATLSQGSETFLGRLRSFRIGVNEIAGVVGIIDDVTEQTSLLSFNAAILAAGSHESHARDFAVVGDEIKDLFERTEASTKDIAQVMGHVHKGAHRSLELLQSSLARIQQGQVVTALAHESVHNLREDMERADEAMRKLREGTQYQHENLAQFAHELLDELKRVEALRGFSGESDQDVHRLRVAAEHLVYLLESLNRSAHEQTESNRHILYVLKRMSEGTYDLRRDLRKLSGDSPDVIELMNDIRVVSKQTREQTEQMHAQLRRLDGLLEEVEHRLAAISLG